MSTEIEDLIQSFEDDNVINTQKAFGDAMNSKINTMLDQERINVANSVFNGIDEDDENFDIDDEDIDDEINNEDDE